MTVISNQVYSAMADQVGVRSINGRVAGDLHDYLSDLQAGTVPFDDIITKGPWVDVRAFGAVGDGVTDDTAAIYSAINAADGKELRMEGKTYVVSHTYISGLSSLKMTGIPGETIIKKKAGSGYTVNIDGAISGIIDFVSCSNITLDGITFDGNKDNATPLSGQHISGVNFYLCDHASTRNCLFVDCEFQGLSHQCTNYVRVSECLFKDCGWAGVGVSGGYFNTYGAKDAIVSDCTFENIWAGMQSQVSMSELTIKDNKFRNSSLILAQDVNYCNIEGNSFIGIPPSGILGEAPQDAITIESDSNVLISGNTIIDSARHGIYVVGNFMPNGPSEGVMVCDNIIIKGNIIIDPLGNGINFSGGSVFTYDVGSHTSANAVNESEYTYCNNAQISNNIIIGSEGAGIGIAVCKNVKVIGNSVSTGTISGIIIGSSKTVDVRENSIFNNSQAGAGVYDGIQLDASPLIMENITIVGNNIFDDQLSGTQRYGIYNNNANSTNFIVADNSYRGNQATLFSAVVVNPINSSVFIAPTLLNGATNFGAGFIPAGYYKDNEGLVHLRGLVALGSSGVTQEIFILPPGYRPSSTEMFVTISNQALGRCDVFANGNVVAAIGSNSNFYSLSGITFYGA